MQETLKKPLIMTSAKEVKKEACGVFKRIQGYMGDRKVKAGVSTEQLALDVVGKGWLHPPLRDEIFVQLAKQTTENPKTESLRRGWELLAIALSIFAPSEGLFGFLESYVARNADPVLDPPEVPSSFLPGLLLFILPFPPRSPSATTPAIVPRSSSVPCRKCSSPTEPVSASL